MDESVDFKESVIQDGVLSPIPKVLAKSILQGTNKSSLHLISKKNRSEEEFRIQKLQIVSCLKKSFAEYPLFQEILLSDSKRLKKIQIWMRMIINFGCKFASIVTISDNNEGVMVFHDSTHHPKVSLEKWFIAGALRLIKWKISEVSKFLYIDDIMTKLQKKLIPSDHIYLMVIGVSPEHQREGHAKTLLTYLINYSQEVNLPIYLETYNVRNEAIYHGFGFKTMEIYEIPKTSLKVYCMLRSV